MRARAYVSGDQQYEMYVNGSRVGKGEAYSFPDSQYYETLDVTHVLHAGAANAIGLLYNWQGPTKGHPAGEPGVIAEIRVTHQDGHVEVITTDGTWRVRKGAWLAGTQRDLEGDLVDYTENINGPGEPIGWDRPGFDASSWAPATVVGPAGTAPWTHLVSVRTRIVVHPGSRGLGDASLVRFGGSRLRQGVRRDPDGLVPPRCRRTRDHDARGLRARPLSRRRGSGLVRHR